MMVFAGRQMASTGPDRMAGAQALPVEKLRWVCDPASLKFATTDDIRDIEGVLGQERAVNALTFGASMPYHGYNIYALGPEWLDKHGVITRFLKERAAAEAPPSDWCYVHNFSNPNKPSVLQLPHGLGTEFKHDMLLFSEDIPRALQSVFDSDEYQTQSRLIAEEFRMRQQQAAAEVDAEARKKSISLKAGPMGFTFVPLHDGRPMTTQEFNALPENERKRFDEGIDGLQKKFNDVLQKIPVWIRELQERQRELSKETASHAVSRPVEELKKKYQGQPVIARHLNMVHHDVIESVGLLVGGASEQSIAGPPDKAMPAIQPSRYQINLLVDNSEAKMAPVVFEDLPSYDHLLGRIEHRAEMGTLLTNFLLIRPGSLHKANGGYLMIDMLKLLAAPLAYENLKNSLKTGEIRMEPLGHALGLISTVTLEPEPIPLSVKVVLIGERSLYYLLGALDPEFSQLFKVAADFEEDMDRKEEVLPLYVRMIATLARREHLMPLGNEAVASVLERSARLAGDGEKFSMRLEMITDLLREAHFFAQQEHHKVIESGDVEAAILAQEKRQSRLHERLLKETQRGTILIDTEGRKIGQVNGLSVIDLGARAFGHPSRITARVGIGRGKVVDIEREVELGGPLHSKGVLILSGYLHSHYLIDKPLSLTASLVFEQSYGGVEGDSASLAELCTLLSAIADVPLRQDLALTGSVNQQGEAQAIGGVNEKIEGFFDLCDARGLSGTQGVLIPESNVKHLMLHSRVINAVREGRFHIYPISTVDQALEALAGMAAGNKNGDGRFAEGSFNHRVQERLEYFAHSQKAYINAMLAEEEAAKPIMH